MAAPLTRCACGAPLVGYCLSTERCEDCDPASLDEYPEPDTCDRCEVEVAYDDLDDDGVCSACLEADEADRQQMSDYRVSVL